MLLEITESLKSHSNSESGQAMQKSKTDEWNGKIKKKIVLLLHSYLQNK